MMFAGLVLLAALCLIAALLEYVCMRCREIPDNSVSLIVRRLSICAWIFFAARFIQLLIDGGSVYWLSMIAFTVLSVSNILRCVNRLLIVDEDFQT